MKKSSIIVMSLMILYSSINTAAASTITPKEQVKMAGLQQKHWLWMSKVTELPIEVLYGLALRESGQYRKSLKTFAPTPTAIGIGTEKKIGQVKHESEMQLSPADSKEMLNDLVIKGHTNLGIGLFQISYKFNRWRAKVPSDLFDPIHNIKAAAGVLLDCKKRHSATHHILSCYRTGKVNEKGLAYASDVLNFAKRYGISFATLVNGNNFTTPSLYASNYDFKTGANLSALELLKSYHRRADLKRNATRTISIIKE